MTAVADQEPLFKQQFATFIFQGFSPFLAARKIWPDPEYTGYCYSKGIEWQNDAYVLQCVDFLKRKNEADLKAKNEPPTKTAQIKRIEARLASMADEDYLKAERLIAEMSGHIERAAPPTAIGNQVINNPVLVVRDHGSDDDWERRSREQQAKLIEHST